MTSEPTVGCVAPAGAHPVCELDHNGARIRLSPQGPTCPMVAIVGHVALDCIYEWPQYGTKGGRLGVGASASHSEVFSPPPNSCEPVRSASSRRHAGRFGYWLFIGGRSRGSKLFRIPGISLCVGGRRGCTSGRKFDSGCFEWPDGSIWKDGRIAAQGLRQDRQRRSIQGF